MLQVWQVRQNFFDFSEKSWSLIVWLSFVSFNESKLG